MSCTSTSSSLLVYRASFQLGSKQKYQSSMKFVTISIVLFVTFTFATAQKNKCDPKLCPNGRCEEGGSACVCDSCWSGQQCQQFVDLHQPHFPTTKHSKVYLNVHHLTSAKSIFVVKAVDEDLVNTCGEKKPCSCGEILYKLVSGDSEAFALNETTGEVRIRNPKKLVIDGEYSLTVRALPAKVIQSADQTEENDYDDNEFRLTVLVEEELGRVKRQLQSSPSSRKKNAKNTADQSAFKNVESFATSFGLRTVTGEVNTLQVGSSIHYRLEIALPRATIDLFLEIYTKDSHTGNRSSPALSLYNFTIPHRVSGISFSTPEPQFFLSNKSRNVYDRMMIDFGAIKNTGPDRNMLTIYFSVVLTRKPGKSETKHTVMIGGEYGKGTLVWVAQSQITTAALSQSEDQVHLGVELAEAPERLALDSAALYRLNANLEFRSDQLRVEVSKPSFEYEPDNILSLGQVSVAKFGKNYLAIPNNSSHYASERSKTVSQLSFSRSVLDMGVVTNIGEKGRTFSNNPENILTFEFPVYALNYAENLNKNVSFTVRILIGSKTVWSKMINASITERRMERSTAKMIASTGAFTAYNVSKGGLVQLLVKSDFADSGGVGSSNFVDYALQVEVPFAGRTAPLFVPCAARFINERSGFNVPYLSAGSVRPVEVTGESGNKQFNFNFGRIHFLNQRTTTNAISGSSASNALASNAGGGLVNEENVVVAEITFRVPFHQEVEEGTVLNAAVKAFSGSKSSKVAILQPEVTVYMENKTSQMDVTTNRSVAWEELIVDGGVAFNVEVEFESNAAFKEFELTVQRSEAGDGDAEQQQLLKNLPPLKICKLALVKVSETDLPCTCVQMDAINENRTTYGALGGAGAKVTGVRDKATLNVGPISVLNTGSSGEGEGEGEGESSSSNTIINTSVYRRRMMANVALMINGGAEAIPEGISYPVTVGVKADGETVWSRTLNFSIASSYSLSDLGIRSMAPKLRLSMVDSLLPGGYITPGYTTNIRLQVIIAPNSIGPLTVEVHAGDDSADELSVCGLWIARIGDNMPCVNEEKKANYDSIVASVGNSNSAARMTFKSITNFGSTVRRSAADEERANTIEFIAMVRVSEAAKSNKTLRVLLTYGLQSEKLEHELVLPVNASDLKLPTEFEKPKVFTLKPADDSNVTHAGVPKLLYFDIELNPNSQVPLTILMDSSSEFKMCSAAFVKIGRNYPCYSAGGALKVSQGKFELGMICNTYLYKESPADNLMRFAVALRPNGNVLPDRTFAVRTIAYTGSTPYSKNELLLSVATNSSLNSTSEKGGGKPGDQSTNTNPPTTTPSTIATSMAKGATVHAASSEGDVNRMALRIRQQKWVPFNVRIPPYTTGALSLHLQGDADESRAILVLHDLKIVAGGSNIPCPLDNGVSPAMMNFNSSVATSQKNIIIASLGNFANFGFSHLLATKGGGGGSNETSDKLADDFLRLEVLVELTDHPSIVEDGSYRIAITTYYGPPASAVVRTGQVKLTPVLQGEPGPKIDVSIKLKKKMEVLDRGDTFTMTATLRHLPESTSEPINPVLRLFTADFIEVIRVDSASSKELPNLLNNTDSRTTDILFPWILFTDEIVVNFTIAIDPNNIRGYGRPEAVLITPYRVLCEHYRTENSGAKTPCSDLKHLNFMTKSSECSGPLGMESGEIADHRITASSAISADYAPTNARPSSAQFWSPALRSGRTEYLQVDFGRRTRVVKVGYKSIRGLRRVATFHLLYSDDGRVWRTAANRSQLVYQGEEGESVVKRPVEAKMYRFVIDQIEASSSKGKSSYVSVRLEFHGCYLEDAVASNETTTKWKTHFSDDPTVINRHIAVDPYTNVIYFCDATLDGHQMCYYSGNSGAQWAILGRSIDSVEGFELATGKFFAVDYQRPAYFSSGNGHLWTPVDFEQFNATVSHSKFHRKIVIPQLHRDDIRKLDIRTGNWRANYDGLYYDDLPNAKAYWKNCCGLD